MWGKKVLKNVVMKELQKSSFTCCWERWSWLWHQARSPWRGFLGVSSPRYLTLLFIYFLSPLHDLLYSNILKIFLFDYKLVRYKFVTTYCQRHGIICIHPPKSRKGKRVRAKCSRILQPSCDQIVGRGALGREVLEAWSRGQPSWV